MAYSESGLNPGAANSKGGPDISTYTSTDAIATVEGAGYFNSASEVLDNANSLGAIMIFDTTNTLSHLRGYSVASGVVTLHDPTIT
jgi:hypothetical protein